MARKRAEGKTQPEAIRCLNEGCPTSSTGPSPPTPTANKPRRLDTEAPWAEVRRYLGPDVLARAQALDPGTRRTGPRAGAPTRRPRNCKQTTLTKSTPKISSPTEGARLEVRCSRLDDKIHSVGRDILLKVDVEGHELSLLRGLSAPSGRTAASCRSRYQSPSGQRRSNCSTTWAGTNRST